MRIISSDAEMRNQYYYAEFRQEQKQRRIQPSATPPLQRTAAVKQQKNPRLKSTAGTKLSACDELTIQLINILLEQMLDLPAAVMPLAELNRYLNQHTGSAKMWQHIAESMPDILLPAHYPQRHFLQDNTRLSPKLEIRDSQNNRHGIATDITLSAMWMNMLSHLQRVNSIENIPQSLDFYSEIRISETNLITLQLDLNLESWQIQKIASRQTEEQLQPYLKHLRIWGNKEINQHRLLAMGIEDFGLVYLGHLNTDHILQYDSHSFYHNNPYNLQKIDCTV